MQISDIRLLGVESQCSQALQLSFRMHGNKFHHYVGTNNGLICLRGTMPNRITNFFVFNPLITRHQKTIHVNHLYRLVNKISKTPLTT